MAKDDLTMRPSNGFLLPVSASSVVACLLLGFSFVVACGAQDATQLQGNLDVVSPRRRLTPQPTASAVSPAPEDLAFARIGPGYLLDMQVYDTPEMSSTLRVDANGDISVPLVGRVHILNETLLEAQNNITKALVDGQILKVPVVSLNVVQYASENATVLGEVQSPGRVQLLGPRNLSEVLALAGGETFSAGNQISIQHTGTDGKSVARSVSYSADSRPAHIENAVIYPGDTVIVERAGAVYVLGGVARPGAYLMLNGGGLNLLEAISLAQGTLLRASIAQVEILRPNGETYSRITVPLGKMQHGTATPTRLQVNDIVYVPISKTKSIFIDGASLLGAAATASIYAIH